MLRHKVFDDTIYYFDKIPTVVEPFTVFWIVTGALLIAVTASIWPAQRAAHLHPGQVAPLRVSEPVVSAEPDPIGSHRIHMQGGRR